MIHVGHSADINTVTVRGALSPLPPVGGAGSAGSVPEFTSKLGFVRGATKCLSLLAVLPHPLPYVVRLSLHAACIARRADPPCRRANFQDRVRQLLHSADTVPAQAKASPPCGIVHRRGARLVKLLEGSPLGGSASNTCWTPRILCWLPPATIRTKSCNFIKPPSHYVANGSFVFLRGWQFRAWGHF